jgi:hypothetical protein
MQIERSTGFVLLGRLQVANVLRLSVDNTINTGTLLFIPALGPFARRPQIDRFSHSAPRYFGRAGQKFRPSNAAFDDNCADSRADVFSCPPPVSGAARAARPHLRLAYK